MRNWVYLKAAADDKNVTSTLVLNRSKPFRLVFLHYIMAPVLHKLIAGGIATYQILIRERSFNDLIFNRRHVSNSEFSQQLPLILVVDEQTCHGILGIELFR